MIDPQDFSGSPGLRRTIVEKFENGEIAKQVEYYGQHVLKLLERLDLKKLDRRLGQVARREENIGNVARTIVSRPGGLKAWDIGRALGISSPASYGDEDQSLQPPLVPGASGLLGLMWFGHVDHITGVLASLEIDRTQVPYLRRAIDALPHTAYASRFDRLSKHHAALNGLATATMLEALAPGTRDVGRYVNFRVEAEKLNRRFAAMSACTMPPDIEAALVRAGDTWFRPHEAVDVQAEQRFIITTSMLPLRLAHAAGSTKVAWNIAYSLAVPHLEMWLYATEHPESGYAASIRREFGLGDPKLSLTAAQALLRTMLGERHEASRDLDGFIKRIRDEAHPTPPLPVNPTGLPLEAELRAVQAFNERRK